MNGKNRQKSQRYQSFRRLVLYAIATFFITTVISVIAFSFINPNLTMLMVAKRVQPLNDGGSNRINHKWVSIDKISPQLVLAVCAAEDNKFMEHNGFDWESIQKAKEHNKKGKRLRGASTITQQTVKNVFLWPRRSWVRKGFEAYFTFLVEVFWSKERIMEVYLNVAELGRGIYGVESASECYYGKPASKISTYEAAMLATVLPNPAKRNPAKPSSYMYRYQRTILRNMYNLGRIDLKGDTSSKSKKKK
ncbi:MAG TPA: monofunctional biosynthetic peptidoglycan transglycosylase [Tenuifilaceae bacterium]|nr:monofunctional biosynthetic peptidoglycan transglycosylase [Tenuifilaceae bacterium]